MSAHGREKGLAARPFARILLIKPSSLGDIVHALPVLHGLRRRYPAAQIDWLVATSCADLLRGHPDLSDLVLFDRKRFGKLGRDLTVTAEFAGFLNGLRGRDYDLVIDLQGLFRSGFMAFASGAPVRLGFADARELAGLFYTHRIPVTQGSVHAADRNYGVAAALGFEDQPMTFNLALREAEHESAARLLAENNVPANRRFAIVVPGARWETKRWMPERFAEVIDRLGESSGMTSVLLGSPDERDLCDRIAARCRTSPMNLAGQTPLRIMAAIISRAAVVLCHDSAPMHLAAALDRPLVALFGPTNPARTGPYSGRARVLQMALPCAPCYLRKLEQCGYSHECMKSIETQAVVSAAIDSFQAGKS